ncbi:MAG: sugar transferase [Rhodothermales bacterium]
MLKRLGDVVLSALLLTLCWPLLAFIAILIVAESGWPVLFHQTRIGLGGHPFDVIKFRTLRPGAHDPAHPAEHATQVGRVLRRWALDELPQLVNVLRGDMSLVGPRPTIPEQVAAYGPFERRRLEVRPGLTGWAQIHGRNALSWPERIRLDVWYVDHADLRLDFRILLQTFRVLWSGKGLYGEGGENPGF